MSYENMLNDNTHNQNTAISQDMQAEENIGENLGPITKRMIKSTLKFV